ncbi:MAG TPA: hypothetical protein VK907_13730, partial [Phnomibacter sp.]|nr:hypothetical protein [Phnomibacter sp.]
MRSFYRATWLMVFVFMGANGFAQPFSCGSPLPVPHFGPKQLTLLDSQLAAAKQHFDHDPHNADAIIWYARRLGYLARY